MTAQVLALGAACALALAVLALRRGPGQEPVDVYAYISGGRLAGVTASEPGQREREQWPEGWMAVRLKDWGHARRLESWASDERPTLDEAKFVLNSWGCRWAVCSPGRAPAFDEGDARFLRGLGISVPEGTADGRPRR